MLSQLSIGQPVSEAMGEALRVTQAARGESLRVPGKQRQHACDPIVDLDGDREASLQAAIGPGTTSSNCGSVVSSMAAATSSAIPSDALSGVLEYR